MAKGNKVQLIKYAPPPPELPQYGQVPPEEVSFIGRTNYVAALEEKKYIFGIKRIDRRRHLYIIGKSGVGKSKVQELMVRQDIAYGHGVCVIDPHGEFIDDIMDFIPEDRIEDVCIIDPADTDFPIAFNPIVNVDREGNTTYVYNQKGILKDVILDKLNSNEIVFLTDKLIEAVNRNPNFLSLEHKALTVRYSTVNFAKITGKAVERLISKWTPSKAERGGMLYPDSKTHEIKPTECENCGVEKTNYGGELDAMKLKYHSNTLPDYVHQIGYWHDHPEDEGIGNTQPSSGPKQDLDVGLDVNKLSEGGIGIIVNKKSITIYRILNYWVFPESHINLNHLS